MILKPLLFYIKVVQVMVKKKYQHQKPGGGGGGQDKSPWTAYPPPMYQLVSSFPTLKTSLQGLSCEYKANTFLYERLFK